mmetsp:Transcript_3348/g.9843  ORF Transcript_3348/g.9843 Transcript_3348/m.9843 type:complete len:449 (-) Transcript_3348:397-1743(-)
MDVEVGEPLLLSDLIASDPAAAREAAKVTDDRVMPGVTSYAGFITAKGQYADLRNHLFFWYVEPAIPPSKGERLPLIVWLQGGPGGSSLFGMWSETGPYQLDLDLNLHKRSASWTERHAVLYIDNPVGTGFSFSETESYVSNAKVEAAGQLHSILEQFFTMFDLHDSADLWIAGESYGGHWVPALSHFTATEIDKGASRLPLRGLAIGNGWVDPVNQIKAYPSLLFDLALISYTERQAIQEYCDQAIDFIERDRPGDAFRVWDAMINGDLLPEGEFPLVRQFTGLQNYFNYLLDVEPAVDNAFSDFVQLPFVRKAIHVGDRPFGATAKQVEDNLRDDFMVSFRGEVEDLLDTGRKVLIYNGQLDVIINMATTRAFLERLEWAGRSRYEDENQQVWRTSKDSPRVAGYIKQSCNLTTAVVRNAGHMVPTDQPEAALDLISRFIRGQPFD